MTRARPPGEILNVQAGGRRNETDREHEEKLIKCGEQVKREEGRGEAGGENARIRDREIHNTMCNARMKGATREIRV